MNLRESLRFRLKEWIGNYQKEFVRSCPLCDHQQWKFHSQYRTGVLVLKIQTCLQCGLIFQSPRLSESSLDQYYQQDYRIYSNDAPSQDHYHRMFERGIRRGLGICRFFDENQVSYQKLKVLEIGCAYGGILETFRRQGCRVKGCDTNPVVNYGMSKGLDIFHGSIDGFNPSEEKADLIILSHVLEHIANLHVFLEKIVNLLNPQGSLYIEVPGVNAPHVDWKRVVQIGHLSYFNLSTLQRLTGPHHLEFIAGNENIQSVFQKK
jgi:SAM-dependent methyltransferase